MSRMLQFAGIFQQQDVAGGGGSPDPVVVNLTVQEFLTNTTTHNVDFPATTTSGNLLLMVVSLDGGTVIPNPPTDFTELYNVGSQPRAVTYAKVATGSEGGTTVNVLSNNIEAGTTQIYQISNWQGTIASGIATGSPATGSTGSNRTPPSLTSGFGSVATLWIVTCHASAAATVSTYPTDFTDGTATIGTAGTGGGQTYSARRSLTASSITPTAFVLSASSTNAIVTNTLAIRGTA